MKKDTPMKVRPDDDTVLEDINDVMNTWKSHFEHLWDERDPSYLEFHDTLLHNKISERIGYELIQTMILWTMNCVTVISLQRNLILYVLSWEMLKQLVQIWSRMKCWNPLEWDLSFYHLSLNGLTATLFHRRGKNPLFHQYHLLFCSGGRNNNDNILYAIPKVIS